MDIIDDYDERTAQHIADKISSESYSTEELIAIKEYEREHKNRVTVTKAVNRVLAMRSTESESEDAEPDPETIAERDAQSEADAPLNEPMPTDDTVTDMNDRPDDSSDTPDAQPEIEGADRNPETVRVALAGGRSGYAAGYLFEDANDVKEVPFNRRVELALERGELRHA